MLATLIPLFDDKMNVAAYSIFAQKENHFLNPNLEGGGRFDGAVDIPALEIVNSMGIDMLSDGKAVFIPVNQFNIFTDIKSKCKMPANKIVLLMDNTVGCDDQYVTRIKELKKQGFKLAIRKLQIVQFEPYRQVIKECDYIFLDHRKIDISKAKIYFENIYPNTKLCAVNVDSQEDYDMLKGTGGYDLYEGIFFRVPVVKSQKEVSPLKATYIELLNVVNSPDFDLTEAADVIGKDPALVISLLEMVNHMTLYAEITSIRHAVAMLGQKELKKWINTAVTRELCADKPSEIMRMSMIRARFAEKLAPEFDQALLAPELFILGLFSNLDIMLDKTMVDALKMVQVSKHVREALLSDKGELAPVFDLMKAYDNADWTEVSRQIVLKNLDMNNIYAAYVDALEWYDKIFGAKVK